MLFLHFVSCLLSKINKSAMFLQNFVTEIYAFFPAKKNWPEKQKL